MSLSLPRGGGGREGKGVDGCSKAAAFIHTGGIPPAGCRNQPAGLNKRGKRRRDRRDS